MSILSGLEVSKFFFYLFVFFGGSTLVVYWLLGMVFAIYESTTNALNKGRKLLKSKKNKTTSNGTKSSPSEDEINRELLIQNRVLLSSINEKLETLINLLTEESTSSVKTNDNSLVK